jgi:hypothetical protein
MSAVLFPRVFACMFGRQAQSTGTNIEKIQAPQKYALTTDVFGI